MKSSRKTSGKEAIYAKTENQYKKDLQSQLPTTFEVIASTMKKIDPKKASLSAIELRKLDRNFIG